MTTKRPWVWVTGSVVVMALAAAGGLSVELDPMLLPGSHRVEVYALDDDVTQVLDDRPGPVGRATGMCDADSYYVEDGGRKLCISLGGPLGAVQADRTDRTVTVASSEVGALRAMAAQDTGATRPTATLVLMAGGPLAMIPVAGLADGRPVSAPALD